MRAQSTMAEHSPLRQATASEATGGLIRLSARLAHLELTLSGMALTAVLALLLLNVVTRAIGQAFFWTDELAVNCMVWMAFLAASASIHHGSNIAVTLLADALPTRLHRGLMVLVNVLVLSFFVVLCVLCWRWFDPYTLAKANWDTSAFSASTFNFIYSEPTQTLGVGKVWFWLIVPVFAVLGSVHAAAGVNRAWREARQTEVAP